MSRLMLAVVCAGMFASCSQQSAECKKYIECVDALNPGTGKDLESRYGQNGSCWTGAPAESESCTTSCKNALNVAKTQANPPEACR